MSIIGGLISLLIPLLVIGFVVRFFMGRARASGAPVARTIGALAHIGVVVAAVNAIGDLIELALPSDEIFEETTRLVAFDIATLVVTIPVAYVIWKALFAVEHDFARRLAVIGGLSVALGTTLFATVRLGRSLTVGDGFDPGAFGVLVAFGGAWAGYEWLRTKEIGDFQVSDLRSTTGSATGLGLSVSGMVLLIETALTELLGVGGDVILERSLGDRLATVGVLLAVGIPALWWFWLRDLSRRETRFRNGYASIASYLGMVALAGGFGTAAFFALDWLFGFGEETAAAQFEAMPALLAAGFVGAAVWIHHLQCLRPRRGLAARAYSYGLAASAVLAGVGGLVTLISLAIEAMTSDALVSTTQGGSAAIAAVLAVAIGGFLWWREWTGVDLELPDERQSMPRRVYLTGLLVVAGLAGGISLVMVLFGILQAALEGTLGLDAIFDGRFVIALVLATTPLIWHLIAEIRADREAEPRVERLRDALVIASDRGPLGNGVHFVARADGHGAITVDIAEQIDTLLAQTGPPVVITVEDDGIRVIEVEAVP